MIKHATYSDLVEIYTHLRNNYNALFLTKHKSYLSSAKDNFQKTHVKALELIGILEAQEKDHDHDEQLKLYKRKVNELYIAFQRGPLSQDNQPVFVKVDKVSKDVVTTEEQMIDEATQLISEVNAFDALRNSTSLKELKGQLEQSLLKIGKLPSLQSPHLTWILSNLQACLNKVNQLDPAYQPSQQELGNFLKDGREVLLQPIDLTNPLYYLNETAEQIERLISLNRGSSKDVKSIKRELKEKLDFIKRINELFTANGRAILTITGMTPGISTDDTLVQVNLRIDKPGNRCYNGIEETLSLRELQDLNMFSKSQTNDELLLRRLDEQQAAIDHLCKSPQAGLQEPLVFLGDFEIDEPIHAFLIDCTQVARLSPIDFLKLIAEDLALFKDPQVQDKMNASDRQALLYEEFIGDDMTNVPSTITNLQNLIVEKIQSSQQKNRDVQLELAGYKDLEGTDEVPSSPVHLLLKLTIGQTSRLIKWENYKLFFINPHSNYKQASSEQKLDR